MNTYLLGALVVAALLVALGLLLRRRRLRRAANDERGAATPAPVGRADAPAQPSPANLAPPALPEPAVPIVPIVPASVDAQRLAATEALRQARQRKADEAARLEAERQAIAQAPAPVLSPVQLPLRPPVQPQQPSAVQPQLPSPVPPPIPTHPRALAPAPTRPPAAAAVPVPRPAERSTPLPRPPAIDATPAPAAAQAGATPGPPAPLRAPTRPAGPPTVLLADDSKVVRVKTGRLLERQGWRVLLAEDGLAALRQLDGEGADLLITDVEMPGLDGFELTRRVRAHPRWGRLPVIMITSSDDRHRDEAAAAGVDLLLGKPYEEDTLLEWARQLLGGAAARIAPAVALH